MEWNWFFSALAQSCAAIVGILGAFIFTKIVSNQSDMNRRRAKFDGLRVDAARLVAQLDRRKFDWYNQQKMKADLLDLETRLRKDTDLWDPDSYYDKMRFSPFVPKDKIIDTIRENIELETTRRQGGGKVNALGTIRRQQEFQVANERPKLEAEREKIDTLVVEVRILASLVSRFLDESRCKPESSSLITTLVCGAILLFFAGVIYPLGMLPADSFSPSDLTLRTVPNEIATYRGALLGIVGAIFAATMVVFGVINFRLALTNEQMRRMEAYRKTSSYSKFLKISESNLES